MCAYTHTHTHTHSHALYNKPDKGCLVIESKLALECESDGLNTGFVIRLYTVCQGPSTDCWSSVKRRFLIEFLSLSPVFSISLPFFFLSLSRWFLSPRRLFPSHSVSLFLCLPPFVSLRLSVCLRCLCISVPLCVSHISLPFHSALSVFTFLLKFSLSSTSPHFWRNDWQWWVEYWKSILK